jgi:hypothetical protein
MALVDVVLDHERLRGSGSSLGDVLANGGFAVSLGSDKKGVLSGLHIFVLASPGLNAGVLKGSSVRKSDGPWLRIDLVDCIQVDGCLLFRLTSGKQLFE